MIYNLLFNNKKIYDLFALENLEKFEKSSQNQTFIPSTWNL